MEEGDALRVRASRISVMRFLHHALQAAGVCSTNVRALIHFSWSIVEALVQTCLQPVQVHDAPQKQHRLSDQQTLDICDDRLESDQDQPQPQSADQESWCSTIQEAAHPYNIPSLLHGGERDQATHLEQVAFQEQVIASLRSSLAADVGKLPSMASQTATLDDTHCHSLHTRQQVENVEAFGVAANCRCEILWSMTLTSLTSIRQCL